ncbi:hypothetical protein GO730_05755 [Spirosoma sp. HMF3257]|uniref:hypothetical protein n=1 Tax=Spirosoma telluris TaxID=2183553 RepID=UPI0012F8AF20|nr:hypothetical protein [Spirosoma telluris]
MRDSGTQISPYWGDSRVNRSRPTNPKAFLLRRLPCRPKAHHYVIDFAMHPTTMRVDG